MISCVLVICKLSLLLEYFVGVPLRDKTCWSGTEETQKGRGLFSSIIKLPDVADDKGPAYQKGSEVVHCFV